MKKRMIAGICVVLCLAGLTGCGSDTSGQQKNAEQTEMSQRETGQIQTAAGEKGAASETDGDGNASGNAEESVGTGFRAPQGSHVDSRGNIVDPEGNTFSKKGEWQVPEGGHVDSKGRIIDKNGNVMGGGAEVGTLG